MSILKNPFRNKDKKLPRFFQRGVLEFERSGHTLTKDRNFYVCSKKQKGLCKNEEEIRIKTKVLERKFSRLAVKFSIPEGNERFFHKNILGKILHTFVDEITEYDPSDEYFNATIDVMEQEAENNNKKQLRSDLKDAKGAYLSMLRQDDVLPLTSILLGTVAVFMRKDASEREIGSILAYLSKKIYLSNKGKITKIRLTKLGNYIVQYIEKYIPNYTKPFKSLLVSVDKFETLEFGEVAKLIRDKKMDNMLPYDPFQSGYALNLYTKLIFSTIYKAKPEDMINYLKLIGSDVQFGIINNLLRLSGVKKPH